jgi:hypothetical protein
MKNALIYGILIGVLSIIWLFAFRSFGYTGTDDKAAPVEYVSVLIPVIGLLLGIRAYKAQLGGNMGFLQALVESFKILIVGGVISIFAFIVYVNYFAPGNIVRDFSGRMFGALLVGVLACLGVSLVMANKANKID